MKYEQQNLVWNLAQKSATSKAVFSMLAVRRRSRHEINLSRFKKLVSLSQAKDRAKFVPKEFEEIFKELERAGLGVIYKGLRGEPRFEWKANLIEIGNAASKRPPKKPKIDTSPEQHSIPEIKPDAFRITEEEGGLTILVPSKLSPNDAKTLMLRIIERVG